MQIKSLRIKSYRSWHIDDSVVSERAQERYFKIQLYEQLRAEGCSEGSALKAIQCSRATLFRWKHRWLQGRYQGLEARSTKPLQTRSPTWSRILESQVLALRQANPCYGKYKIQALLKRGCGLSASVAMVGRILSQAIKKGKIKAVPALLGRRYPKKKRIFNQHAKRWQYGMKAQQPGELVQIDHMSITHTGSCLKHFKAICPTTRFMVAQVFRRATSRSAASFLDAVIREMPFKVRSIQVDGGSEFMKDFEQACAEKGIALFVLPPKKPEYNGKVERCNGSTRDEFYAFYGDVYNTHTVNAHLKQYQDHFNTYRPHQALQYLTPMAYYQRHYQNEASQSQML